MYENECTNTTTEADLCWLGNYLFSHSTQQQPQHVIDDDIEFTNNEPIDFTSDGPTVFDFGGENDTASAANRVNDVSFYIFYCFFFVQRYALTYPPMFFTIYIINRRLMAQRRSGINHPLLSLLMVIGVIRGNYINNGMISVCRKHQILRGYGVHDGLTHVNKSCL